MWFDPLKLRNQNDAPCDFCDSATFHNQTVVEDEQKSQESQKSQAGEVLKMQSDATGAHFMWQIESKTRGILQVSTWPPSTLAEVMRDFPDAVRAEPMPDDGG